MPQVVLCRAAMFFFLPLMLLTGCAVLNATPPADNYRDGNHFESTIEERDDGQVYVLVQKTDGIWRGRYGRFFDDTAEDDAETTETRKDALRKVGYEEIFRYCNMRDGRMEIFPYFNMTDSPLNDKEFKVNMRSVMSNLFVDKDDIPRSLYTRFTCPK